MRVSPRVRRDVFAHARTLGPSITDGLLVCLAFLGFFRLLGRMPSLSSAFATLAIAIAVSTFKHSRMRRA